MLFVFKKSRLFSAILILALVVFGCGMLKTAVFSDKEAFLPSEGRTIIIDAGHGGFDGGATAPDGTSEKDINLAVSLKLKKILTLYGYDVITLRDTDTALNTEGDTTRSKKRSDIINRYAVMEANPDSIYLCIHQNNFSAS